MTKGIKNSKDQHFLKTTLHAVRVFLLQSRMFASTKVQSVATLNKINIGALTSENIRLILRSFMSERGGKILGTMVLANWMMFAWLIRLSESLWNLETESNEGISNIINTMWLVAVTFTTIGYGDYYPRSHFARFFCLWLGFSGTITTAILVSLMTEQLSMTRRERLLYRVLNSDKLHHRMREKAAILLQRVIRSWLKGELVFEKIDNQKISDDRERTEASKSRTSTVVRNCVSG